MRKKTPVPLEEEKRIAWYLYEQAKNSEIDHVRISGAMSRVNFVDWKIINSGRRDLLGE